MGAIDKKTRNKLPKVFEKLVREKNKSLFQIFDKEFVKNREIGPDESIVFEYLEDLVKMQKNYRHKSRRSSFSMLGVPVGAELVASFNSEVKVRVLDSKNLVRDLSDGEELSISKAAEKYLGGSKNGYDWFCLDGKKLSEIRREKDLDYLK